MAAADYYGGQQQQNVAGPSQTPARAPAHQPPPSQNMLNPNPPYPVFDGPPPPYTAYADHPRPHSQPPPQHRPPTTNQYRPQPPSNGPPPTHAYPEKTQADTHAYPPEKTSRQVNNMYKPSDFGAPYPPQTQQPQQQPYLHPQQPQGYFPLAGTPAMAQVYGNGTGSGSGSGYRPSTTPGYRPPQSPYRDDYRRDDSRARSRSRSRSRHRKYHHHDRPQVQQKKSSSAKNTFLGAGGGAILGDAIFPGLGTLSGAILGGLGGHEYTKRRTTSNPSRAPRSRSYSNEFDYGDYNRGRRH